ncbi:hypothetical protein Acsp05_23630 [Actinokineospora sp. NBRC 105648]|nr:hypothetical protein Acsp05_23630 [Actinokineospora sp. NBRC 105648]
MTLPETYAAKPEVTGLGDLPDAWHWSAAPGRDSTAALSDDGKHAFEAHARDSFDEGLAIALLSMSASRQLAGARVRAVEPSCGTTQVVAHPPCPVAAIAVAGPVRVEVSALLRVRTAAFTRGGAGSAMSGPVPAVRTATRSTPCGPSGPDHSGNRAVLRETADRRG